jgi:hypothetical protein
MDNTVLRTLDQRQLFPSRQNAGRRLDQGLNGSSAHPITPDLLCHLQEQWEKVDVLGSLHFVLCCLCLECIFFLGHVCMHENIPVVHSFVSVYRWSFSHSSRTTRFLS